MYSFLDIDRDDDHDDHYLEDDPNQAQQGHSISHSVSFRLLDTTTHRASR